MRIWTERNARRRSRRSRFSAIWQCFRAGSWSRTSSALLLLAACDIPTVVPKLETKLLLPVEATAVGVAALLPSSVQVVDARFRFTTAATAMAPRSLGSMCGTPCVAVQGLTVAKPAFSDSGTAVLSLPVDVTGATLSGGALDIAVTHNLGFDVLRPSGATQQGTLRIIARNSGRVIGTTTIDEAFPSGTTLQRTLAVAPGDVTGDVVVSIVLQSPAGGSAAGDRVRIDTNASLSASLAPATIDASSARVLVQQKQVSIDDVAVDLSAIDDGTSRRVQAGTAVLTIDNPFAVAGTLDVRLVRPGFILTKPVPLAAGHNSARIPLNIDEIRALLGHTLTMSARGPVSSGSGAVSVQPGQKIGIATSIELQLELGGG
jgi:hypothetical protein